MDDTKLRNEDTNRPLAEPDPPTTQLPMPTGPLPNLSPGAASLPPDQEEELEHPEGDNDRDSAYEESFEEDSQASDTVSLMSAITKYRYENGRQYHAYRDGAYWAPNDEIQNDQQDMAHHLWLLTLDNKLYLAPISNPQVS